MATGSEFRAPSELNYAKRLDSLDSGASNVDRRSRDLKHSSNEELRLVGIADGW